MLLQEKWNQLINIINWEYKNNKKQENVFLRYYFFAWAKGRNYSFTEIGKIVNRDHSSVIAGLKVHKNLIETNDYTYLDLLKTLERNLCSIDINSYQVVLCNKCLGYVFYEKYPIKNVAIFSKFMRNKYKIHYTYLLPKPCNCHIINSDMDIIKKITHELKKLDDTTNHYEFFHNNTWYDLYFDFHRETDSEQGGEPDEILSYYKIDYIFIRDILCFKSGGESLPPDWTFAKKIEKLYNL